MCFCFYWGKKRLKFSIPNNRQQQFAPENMDNSKRKRLVFQPSIFMCKLAVGFTEAVSAKGWLSGMSFRRRLPQLISIRATQVSALRSKFSKKKLRDSWENLWFMDIFWGSCLQFCFFLRVFSWFVCFVIAWHLHIFVVYTNPICSMGLEYLPTWNLFVLYFGASTLQNKALSNQNKGHLGSRYIYHKFMVNVGKYSSPMEHLGMYWLSVCGVSCAWRANSKGQ